MKKLLEQETRRELFLLLDHYLIARESGEYVANGRPEEIENEIWKWHNNSIEAMEEL